MGNLGHKKDTAVPGCEACTLLAAYTPLVVADSYIMFSHTSQLSLNGAMHI